jgi:hypothetical protein
MATKFTRFTNVEVTGELKANALEVDDLSASNVFKGDTQQARLASIATTGNSDTYMIAPQDGVIVGAMYSGSSVLAASDTNFVTWSITNLGQAGAGSTAILAATDANTTKATGGTALAADARRNLVLNATAANLVVARGDRLRIRAAATGTLANAVASNVYLLEFDTE